MLFLHQQGDSKRDLCQKPVISQYRVQHILKNVSSRNKSTADEQNLEVMSL